MMQLLQLRNGDRCVVADVVDPAIYPVCGSCEQQGLTYIGMVRHMHSFRRIPIACERQKFRDMRVPLTVDKRQPYNAQA